MDLVLFGIQGSGKGTQTKRLAAEKGYEIFEAGGALRKIAALAPRSSPQASEVGSVTQNQLELARTVKSFIDVGKLVPHEIIMDVLKNAIESQPKEQKILFDGVPRDLDQMRDFTAIMEKLGRDFRCLHITLDPEVGVQRILKRAQIEGRADDASEETIRKRMRTFTGKTMPVIESYKKNGKVVEIEGLGNTEEIYQRILSAVA